jgi:hypothetical protein
MLHKLKHSTGAMVRAVKEEVQGSVPGSIVL